MAAGASVVVMIFFMRSPSLSREIPYFIAGQETPYPVPAGRARPVKDVDHRKTDSDQKCQPTANAEGDVVADLFSEPERKACKDDVDKQQRPHDLKRA